jgi:hypothetical protein
MNFLLTPVEEVIFYIKRIYINFKQLLINIKYQSRYFFVSSLGVKRSFDHPTNNVLGGQDHGD